EGFATVVAGSDGSGGPSSFTGTTKNGAIYEYGTTANAQIHAGTTNTISVWALAAIRDRVGNKVTFTYTVDANSTAFRLAQIQYPITATGLGPFYQVSFSYGSRAPASIPTRDYLGYELEEPNRLNTITVQSYGGSAIRTYNLSYGVSPTTNR